jgi:phage anti-repressor protein
MSFILTDQVRQQIDAMIKEWVEVNNDTKSRCVAQFNLIWKWAGYTQKCHAKTALQKSYKENIDYSTFEVAKVGNRGDKPKKKILLTLNAAKQFLFQAPTDQGKAIWVYFIEAENKWRELKKDVKEARKTLLLTSSSSNDWLSSSSTKISINT